MTTIRAPAHAEAVEHRLAARLGAALAEQAEAVPHDVAERLRVARQQALARARTVRAARAIDAGRLTHAAPAGEWPTVAASVRPPARGGSASGATVSWWQRTLSALPLAMLVAGLVMVDRVAEVEQVRAAAEIDSQLLADALPPTAYADPGFAEFLRSPAP